MTVTLKKYLLYSFSLLIMVSITLAASPRTNHPQRATLDEDYLHYTSVGNLGLTVTNIGILGQGFNTEGQPSCWYQLRTDSTRFQVEHLSYAGIWIGGQKDGERLVSTAIYDGVFHYDDGGMEFTVARTNQIEWNPIFQHLAKADKRFDLSRVASDSVVVFNDVLEAPIQDGIISFGTTDWDTIVTRSILTDTSASSPYRNYALLHHPDAVSHQDLICAYTDTNTTIPGEQYHIPDHQPLGVHVVQEAYAWNFEYGDDFVILYYTITNIPDDYFIAEEYGYYEYETRDVLEYDVGDTVWLGNVIQQPRFGVWTDASIGNMNYTNIYDDDGGPGGRWSWYDNMPGFAQDYNMGIGYDYDGDAGWSQSYLGVRMLGAEPSQDTTATYFHPWVWLGSMFPQDWPMLVTEEQRYVHMTRHPDYENIPTDMDHQQSWILLTSHGPYPNLLPGQRLHVAFAVVGGRWQGDGADSEARRANLYTNSEWAQVAYNGEDVNGNGLLDPGEDLDNDGVIDRWQFIGTVDAPERTSGRNVPRDFAILSSYPNPFNGQTIVQVDLERTAVVELDVINVLGQHVATLHNGKLQAGYRQFAWNADSLPSGVYFVRMQTEVQTLTKRLLLVR